MTRRWLVFLAAGGSLGLLLAAWGFEYLGGLAPCQMCLWQRWPHLVAVPVGVLALGVSGALLPLLGAGAALTTAGIGLYHTGVERGFWPGPSACSGGGDDLGAMSGADLLSLDITGSVVMCDEVAWSLAGLSMASWNALASLALAALWLAAALRSRQGAARRA